MSQLPRIMKPWATLLVCGLLAGGPAGTRAADTPALPRFSQLLATPDRAATGLDRLSSDQLAVLDALVRRDLVAQSAPRRTDAPAPPARFSQRLTDDERRNAGLAALTAAERVRLDAFAERNASVTLARTLLSPPTFVPPASARAWRKPPNPPARKSTARSPSGWASERATAKNSAA